MVQASAAQSLGNVERAVSTRWALCWKYVFRESAHSKHEGLQATCSPHAGRYATAGPTTPSAHPSCAHSCFYNPSQLSKLVCVYARGAPDASRGKQAPQRV